MQLLEAERIAKIYSPRLFRGCRSGSGTGAGERDAHAALIDVSLTLGSGEALGIVGANGAGKSTLLRILAGLAQPTRGRVRCIASRGALLDLGAGFIDELSGLENARLALRMLGWHGDPELIERVFRFADLEDFSGEPVRSYSTGMRLRLAYAVAVAIEPSILLVDELLAVGDEAFQRKCSQHIARFLTHGGSLVLASHNLYQVEKLCSRAIWLDHGRVRASGPARMVTGEYQASLGGDFDADSISAPEAGRIQIEISGVGEPEVNVGEPMRIRLAGSDPSAEGMRLELGLRDGTTVAALSVRGDRQFECLRCPLVPGRYWARLSNREGRILAVRSFDCRGDSRELGSVRLLHAWG